MGEQLVGTQVEEAVVALDAALDRLAGLVLYPLSQEELLTLLRRFETARRRLPTIDHMRSCLSWSPVGRGCGGGPPHAGGVA